MKARHAWLTVGRIGGGIVGYGCMAAFLWLIGLQLYRWFRDGEWTRVGVSDGLHVALAHCCVDDAGSGRFAALAEWLDAPASWLGLHRVLEVIPASLALFAASILGNFVYLYAQDRLDGAAATATRPRPDPTTGGIPN